MFDIELRLPKSLHNLARELAQEEDISLNQLITLALAEKVSALRTESYLAERAARGDRAKFETANVYKIMTCRGEAAAIGVGGTNGFVSPPPRPSLA